MTLSIRDWKVRVQSRKVKPEQVFIRFGMWDTRANVSYNHSTKEKERGLSVYPAKWKGKAITLDESEVVAEHPDLPSRYAFPVTGTIVGYVSDGEPVLKGVRVLPYPLNLNTKRI